MAATILGLSNKLETLRANPIASHRLILRTQTLVRNGADFFVEASNPAVMLLESIVAVGSAQMMQAETLFKRAFKSMAVTAEDLYLHMSDSDYLNRFSTPGETSFNFYFSYDELLVRSVPLNDGTNVRLIRIPKHTQITIAGITFTMQYPIDIRILPQGGMSILFNTDEISPIQRLTTNVVNWGITMLGTSKLVKIEIPVKQMLIVSNIAQLNSITGFVKDYAFTDSFYYARVYTKREDDGIWAEIKTTHTDQVYDVVTPTAVLKLLDGALRVYIPQIYFNTGAIKDSLRIDIYTTKGPMDISFGNYDSRNYTIHWLDRDNELTSIYSAPLNVISGYEIVSDKTLTGGSLGVSITDLRNQIIDDSGKKDLPITDKQLFNPRNTLGYDIVKNVDNITDRQYLAAKALPAPDNEFTVTGMGCGINTLQTSFTGLLGQSTVANNLRRMTIKPDTLFKSVNGVIKVVPDAVVTALKNPLVTGAEVLANSVNSENYLFTPFYYVLDASHEEFDIRPYRLDDPIVSAKYFDKQNTSLLIDVSSREYVVVLNPTGAGYLLSMSLQTSAEFLALPLDKVFIQLSFVPPNTSTRVHINGVLVSPIDSGTGKPANGLYIYHFHLDSNFDVNENHRLVLTPSMAAIDLETVFDVVFIVKDHLPSGSLASEIDTLFDKTLLPGYNPASIYKGLVNEKYTVLFGHYLKYLWNRARSLADSLQYVKHNANIPAVYTQNVYERENDGSIKLTLNALTGVYETTLVHTVGDPVLDSAGAPILRHQIGDTVMDANGEPVLVNAGRDTLRQMDLLFLDGKYYFATNDTTVNYTKDVVKRLTEWIISDIETLNGILLDRSEMFFYPKTSMGALTVYTTDEQTATIPADHHFKLTYHVKEYITKNTVLRDSIRRATARILAECLSQPVISRSTMIDKLKAALGDDVLSISLSSNVFSDDLYQAFTIKDNSNLPIVGKQLIALSNQTLAVQDAITIDYVTLTK